MRDEDASLAVSESDDVDGLRGDEGGSYLVDFDRRTVTREKVLIERQRSTSTNNL